MDLPGLGFRAGVVPGVEADEVVTDECDGHERGRDEPGLSENPRLTLEPLVAVGADKTLDERPERQAPSAVDCQGAAACRVPSRLSGAVEVLPHPRGCAGAQVVVRMVCSIRIDARGVGAADLEGMPVDRWAGTRCAPLCRAWRVGTNRVELAGVGTPHAVGTSRRRSFSAVGASSVRWVSGDTG